MNENQVKEIKIMLNKGFSQQKIADLFDMGKTMISHINTGRNWKHVTI